MRISKSNHLKRLLQTQDVLIGTLCYLLLIDGLHLLGVLMSDSFLVHLQLSLFVLVCCVFASVSRAPKLHGESVLAQLVFASRYALIVLTGMLALAYVGQLDFVSRQAIVGASGLIFLALFVNRLFLRWWYLKGRRESPANYLKILVIGSGDRARKLIETYREQSEWGVTVVGILDPKPEERPSQLGPHKVLGDVHDIHRVLATEVVDEVVVCVPRSLLDDVAEIIAACDEEAICVKFLADLYDMPGGAEVHLERLGAMPILSFDPVYHDESRLIIKRVIDLLVVLPALVVLLPLFMIVAIAIRLDSKGPVLFSQQRVGMNKRVFRMLKFRSMHQDAEARLAEIEHLNEADGPIFKVSKDPRITRVGRFIRRTSIDELPQLINVLLGHMSLVGPRPMSLRDVSRFSLGVQRRRFSVRPGLACLREISGRSRLSFDEWLELDLKYIKEWSLWLDIKILLMLVPIVMRGDGAV